MFLGNKLHPAFIIPGTDATTVEVHITIIGSQHGPLRKHGNRHFWPNASPSHMFPPGTINSQYGQYNDSSQDRRVRATTVQS